jgi:hypothetical protein
VFTDATDHAAGMVLIPAGTIAVVNPEQSLRVNADAGNI